MADAVSVIVRSSRTGDDVTLRVERADGGTAFVHLMAGNRRAHADR